MDIKRFLGNFARTTLAIGALSVSAYAGADEFYPPMGGEWGGGAPFGQGPCCPPPSCEAQCNPAPICNYGYNPPAYLRCGGQNGCESFCETLGARVDFLWWRASEDCLTLGTEEFVATFPPIATGTLVENFSETRKPDFKFDAGFRLGLSHYSTCNCFDVALNWTHFHTTAKARGFSEFGPEGLFGDYTVFVPAWERFTGVFPDFTRSNWKLDLDLLDLEFGHKYYVANCFILRPHIGLRGARINQRQNVFAVANRTTVAIGAFDNYESFVSARNNFLAIGPRIGLDLEIDLGCGLAIVGQAGASILFGRFSNASRETFTSFDVTTSPTTTDTIEYHAGNHSKRYSRTTTDLAIGLAWNHCFTCCNRAHPVSIAVLWEHHGFYNLNNFNFHSNGYDPTLATFEFPFVSNNECCRQGDLFTQGLTVSFNLGF